MVLTPCCLPPSLSLPVPAVVETVAAEAVVVAVESVLPPEQTVAKYIYGCENNLVWTCSLILVNTGAWNATYQLHPFQWKKSLQHFLHLSLDEWCTHQHLGVD